VASGGGSRVRWVEEVPVSSEPAGEQAVDAAHMQALAVAALRSAGFTPKEERVLPTLLHKDTRLVKADGVDLTELWSILIEKAGLTPTLAGRVMLLTVIYLDSHVKVPLSIPQDVRIAMKMALPTFPDLEGHVASLITSVEALRKDPPALPAPSRKR
jgi:hypothetical protein